VGKKMIKLIKLIVNPFKNRVGKVLVKYYDVTLDCELWLWRSDALFLKMPEIRKGENVIHLLRWDNKEISDVFQKEVLAQLFADTDMTLEKAVELRQKWFLDDKAKKESQKIKDAQTAANQINKVKQLAENEKAKESKVLNSMKGFTEVKLSKQPEKIAKFVR